jgi:hypothetical protein
MFGRIPLRRQNWLCWPTLILLVCLAPVCLHSAGPAPDDKGKSRPTDEVGTPVYVYKDEGLPGKFIPAGWMPDGEGIAQSTSEKDTPHSKPHCLRLHCQLSKRPWVGVYFLLAGEWEPKQTFNLFTRLKAKRGDPIRCRFWARSRQGAEVQFKVGGVTKGKIRDSLTFPVATPWVKLTPKWKMYEIDLTGKDVSSLVGGFMWVCDRAHNSGEDVSFDLDTIYFVKTKNKSGKTAAGAAALR